MWQITTSIKTVGKCENEYKNEAGYHFKGSVDKYKEGKTKGEKDK